MQSFDTGGAPGELLGSHTAVTTTGGATFYWSGGGGSTSAGYWTVPYAAVGVMGAGV